MGRVYLDHNATTPLRAEARAAMIAAMDVVGNPSSVHAEGRAAKRIVEDARRQVSQAVGCKPAEVVFTSGATEAASLLARTPQGFDVFVEETAHDALRAHLREIAWVNAAKGPGHTYAMGVANSETGIVSALPQKVDGQWPVGHAAADWLLLDITQAVGRVPFSFAWSGADFAVLSAHKFGGPKGVGALIVRDTVDVAPLAVGGGQEMGRRSGTENIIGIAGFGAAAEAATQDLVDNKWARVEKLRTFLESELEAAEKGTIFVGKGAQRLPNTSCIITPGWKGETQVMALDLAGFAVSAGSACSSGKVRASNVLRAMGYNEGEASSAIRVSLGLETTEAEVAAFCESFLKLQTKHLARAA